jgi:hypothetical protein
MPSLNRSCCVFGLAVLGICQALSATTIGPGTSQTDYSGLDGPDTDGRLDIYLTNPITLSAGTYQATTFDFAYGQAGSVQPFLATGTGINGTATDSFTVVATGSVQTVSAPAVSGQTDDQGHNIDISSVAFGTSSAGSDIFVVPSGGETIYAGIDEFDSEPVEVDVKAGQTDSDGEGTALPLNQGDTVGGTTTLTPLGTPGASDRDFDYPDGGRELAYSIDAVAVPEPGELAIVGLVAVGALSRVRRGKQMIAPH